MFEFIAGIKNPLFKSLAVMTIIFVPMMIILGLATQL